MASITMNPESFKELKTAYKMAVKDKVKTFMFHGHEILTDYAKHMIEYMEDQMESK